jgi:hypothetical protein
VVNPDPSAGPLDPVPGSAAEPPSLDRIFAASAQKTDAILAVMPHNLLEARRTITKELGLKPTPEQLQTIVKLAHESPLDESLAELPRSFLRTLIRARRALHSLQNARPLSPEGVRLDGRIIERVLQQGERLDAELCAIVTMAEDLPHEARNFLLQAGDALKVPREELLAARRLVPKLEAFAAARDSDTLRRTVPSLSAEEAHVILEALGDADDARPVRVCVDGLALRSLILEDLERFVDLRSVEPAPDDALGAALDELQLDKQAYHVVSERLQRQRDATLVADLHDCAEEIREVGRSLFSTYLRLAHTMNESEAPDGPDGDAAGATESDLGKLLQEVAEAEERAETSDGPVSEDELYLKALKDVKPPERRPLLAEGAEDLRRERVRMIVLSTITVVLAAASLIVNFLVFGARPSPGVELAAEDFSPHAPVGRVDTLGPVMFTEVESWDGMSEVERENRTLRIGQEASARGLSSVFLKDEDGRLAATWSRENGVELVPGSESPPGR